MQRFMGSASAWSKSRKGWIVLLANVDSEKLAEEIQARISVEVRRRQRRMRRTNPGWPSANTQATLRQFRGRGWQLPA